MSIKNRLRKDGKPSQWQNKETNYGTGMMSLLVQWHWVACKVIFDLTAPWKAEISWNSVSGSRNFASRLPQKVQSDPLGDHFLDHDQHLNSSPSRWMVSWVPFLCHEILSAPAPLRPWRWAFLTAPSGRSTTTCMRHAAMLFVTPG